MKTAIRNILVLLVMTVVASCTSNNGDIGPWFGTWKVTEVRCDGEAEEQYAGNMFFKFQSSVFEVLVVNDHHFTDTAFGEWREEPGGKIVIWFPDQSYEPAQESHFAREANVLTYDAVKASGFLLTLKATDGHTYTYRLVKW